MGGKDESRASVAAHYVGAMKALRAAIFGPLSWRRRASKPDVGSRMQHPTPPHPLLSHAVWLLFLLRAGVGVGGGGHSLRKRKALGKHYHFQEGEGEKGSVVGPNSPWLNELPALGAAAAGRRGIRPWKL